MSCAFAGVWGQRAEPREAGELRLRGGVGAEGGAARSAASTGAPTVKHQRSRAPGAAKCVRPTTAWGDRGRAKAEEGRD